MTHSLWLLQSCGDYEGPGDYERPLCCSAELPVVKSWPSHTVHTASALGIHSMLGHPCLQVIMVKQQ